VQLIYGVLAFIALLGGGLILIYITKMKFQLDQALKDTGYGYIENNEFNDGWYFFQSSSDSLSEVNSTIQMRDILMGSELFNQLVKSAEKGIDVFAINNGDFLKEYDQLRKDIATEEKTEKEKKEEAPPEEKKDAKPGNTKKPKAGAEPKAEGEDEDEEMPITPKPSPKMATLLQRLDILKQTAVDSLMQKMGIEDLLKDMNANHLHLYYRPVECFTRMLDPNYESWSLTKKVEMFANVKNIFYLLEQDHKKSFKFPERIHPRDEAIKLRLGFFHWTYKGEIAKDVPFFIDARLASAKTLTDKSLSDAKMKAMTYLTFLSVDRDLQMSNEINRQKKKLADYETKQSEGIDDYLNGLLDEKKFEGYLGKHFELKPLSLTATIFGAMMAVIGVLIGRAYF
jgi:hypothetical protein